MRRLTAVLALMLLALGTTQAQTVYPTLSARSWNSYVASVVPQNWSSIIDNGGTFLTGSGSQTQNNALERIYTYSMPFPFTFLSPGYVEGITTYPQGTTIIISTNGYISFANTGYGSTGGTQTGYSYYGYYKLFNTGGPHGSNVIAPFSSWLSGNGVAGAGIYVATLGSAPNRTFVVEWRMTQGNSYGGNDGSVGNFQARLSEATGNIEFQYSDSPINILYYFYGTIVGLKKYGESYLDYTQPTATTRGTPEWARYFLFNNPGYGQGDTVAITAMTHRWWGSYGYAEYYPWNYSQPASGLLNPYMWHFSFPTDAQGQRIGYKLSPVINDVSTSNVTFSPVTPAFAYAPGQDVTVTATFTNNGAAARQNVPVVADLWRNGVKTTSITGTAFPNSTPQFGTNTYTFTTPFGFNNRYTDTTGVYEVRVYPQLATDQDAANDTARGTFYISRDHDMMPFTILQPLSNLPP
ncbi:MAG TPA: hypothetical protein VNA88_15720, partial [Candidatus Kapabacteria bacterium]|nr:hypothetical protein [Candidatus Kapabacteria bacterium]